MHRPLSEIQKDIDGALAFANHYDDLYDHKGYYKNMVLVEKYRAEYNRALENEKATKHAGH